MAVSESGIAGSAQFPRTSWSVIREVQDPDSPEYQRHLRRLIELYWRPVYTVIRHGWRRPHDEAKDLTQEFFATVILERDLVKAYAPERGSFRAFLRTAVQRFMAHVVRDAGSQKRGGGQAAFALDVEEAERVGESFGDAAMSPEEIFDLAWHGEVMREAVRRLEAELAGRGKAAGFEAFRRYDLDGDSSELSYGALGEQLSMSAVQVKNALHEARAMFRDIVTDIVRGYVDGPDELTAELRLLFGA